MNLIANRHLDGAQKQVIYELTLKKRQSKKSTMSDRHRAAKQQLAKELMLERKIQPSLGSISSQHTIDSLAISATSTSDSMSHLDQQSLLGELLLPTSTNSSPSTGGTCQQVCRCAQTTRNDSCHRQHHHQQQPLQTTIDTTSGAQNVQQPIDSPDSKLGGENGTAVRPPSSRLSCTSNSFTRSDSSYSGSSASIMTADSCSSGNQRHNAIEQQLTHSMIESADSSKEIRRKEACIKVHKLKLEHLNSELERRLHQYEYLVAEEKAILGAYNMMLFTNQGVNNFHLHRDI